VADAKKDFVLKPVGVGSGYSIPPTALFPYQDVKGVIATGPGPGYHVAPGVIISGGVGSGAGGPASPVGPPRPEAEAEPEDARTWRQRPPLL
jgi:hypothetical protein